MIKFLFVILRTLSHIVLKKIKFLFILFSIPLIADNISWLKDNNNGCKVGFTYFKNVVAINFKGKCDSKNFAKEGEVKFTVKDGNIFVYSGELKNGLFDGIGDVTFPNGDVIAGIWKDGYPKDEITFIKDGITYRCNVNSNYRISCEIASSKFGKSREMAVLRWASQYVGEVVKETKRQFKEALKMEAEAPAYCKERRANCKAHCFGDKDCISECSYAFVKCYEDYKMRNK